MAYLPDTITGWLTVIVVGIMVYGVPIGFLAYETYKGWRDWDKNIKERTDKYNKWWQETYGEQNGR